MTSSGRVHMGTHTRPHQYPWMAHLRIAAPDGKGFMQCGGAIIDPETILTAAHCVHGEDGRVVDVRALQVWLGTHDYRRNEGAMLPVRQILIDRRYNRENGLDYDICLLKMSMPIAFNAKVKPICIPSDNHIPSNKLTVVILWWSVYTPLYRTTGTLSDPTRELVYAPSTPKLLGVRDSDLINSTPNIKIPSCSLAFKFSFTLTQHTYHQSSIN